MRPALMQDRDMIAKQFNEVEEEIDKILNIKGWTTEECLFIIRADINTNLDGDTYRGVGSLKTKLKVEKYIQEFKVV